MDTDFSVSHSSGSRRCIWIFFLFLLLLLMPPPAASGREPYPEAPGQTAAVSVPVLAWNWGTLFNPVQSALGNRRRMIQMATIGMCIGLYILMRK